MTSRGAHRPERPVLADPGDASRRPVRSDASRLPLCGWLGRDLSTFEADPRALLSACADYAHAFGVEAVQVERGILCLPGWLATSGALAWRHHACAPMGPSDDLDTRIITVSRSIVHGIVTTPKNYRIRRLPMSADLNRVFDARRDAALVFSRPGGEPLGLCMAEDALKRMCARAGIRPIGWHALRHTFASGLAAAGVPLTSVKDLLGHATIAMTMHYAHVSSSALRDAIAVLERACPLPCITTDGQQVGIERRKGALHLTTA